jgi:hypothetical protein
MEQAEIVSAYNRLDEHVRFLHAYWYLFRQLYRAPADRQELLNAVIPQFFVLLEKTTIRTVFLEFRLITEKPVTMGRRNASLRGLLEAIHADAWEQQEAAAWVTAVEQNSAVNSHVNRSIAHIDWNTAAGNEAAPGSVELDDVEQALQLVRDVMKHLTQQLNVPVRDYRDARIDAEIDTLLKLLSDASASGSHEVH